MNACHGERMGIRTDEPIENRHIARRHLERMVMLSDGIFAIAITLSAIELKPEGEAAGSLWRAWSMPLLIYFISFFIIGQLWMMHRRFMAHLRDIDSVGAAINLVLLSLVSLMPVLIRFALTNKDGGEATQVYSLGLAITYVCMNVLWTYLAFVARLAPDVRPGLARSWTYECLFITFAFIAVAAYAGRQMIVLAVFSVIALAARWLAARSASADK